MYVQDGSSIISALTLRLCYGKSQPKANYFKVINGRLSPCCVRYVWEIFVNGGQNCTSLLTVK
jgi:hypothetical protein